MAAYELVDVGQSAQAIAAFEADKGHIPTLVRAALLQRLLMHVTRLHDKNDDTDSLPAFFGLLERPNVRAGLLLGGPDFDAPFKFAEET